jgi:hypothetical protein
VAFQKWARGRRPGLLAQWLRRALPFIISVNFPTSHHGRFTSDTAIGWYIFAP